MPGWLLRLQALQEESQLLSGRLEEMEYLLNQKLEGLRKTKLKNNERMDRLATDTAAAQKRMAMIDQYLNLEACQGRKNRQHRRLLPPLLQPSRHRTRPLSARQKSV
jgi:TolA-binding protein